MDRKRHVWLGWLLTALWIIVFVCLTSGGNFSEMKPNEWGDWAAGLTAPIAFLWLVLGYFQQGKELRANVDALRLQEKALQLQVKELSESVEQQTALAKATAKQAEVAEKAQVIALRSQIVTHQPTFIGFVPQEIHHDRIVVGIQNIGAKCFNATITLAPDVPGGEKVISPPGSGADAWMARSMVSFVFYLGQQPSALQRKRSSHYGEAQR